MQLIFHLCVTLAVSMSDCTGTRSQRLTRLGLFLLRLLSPKPTCHRQIPPFMSLGQAGAISMSFYFVDEFCQAVNIRYC